MLLIRVSSDSSLRYHMFFQAFSNLGKTNIAVLKEFKSWILWATLTRVSFSHCYRYQYNVSCLWKSCFSETRLSWKFWLMPLQVSRRGSEKNCSYIQAPIWITLGHANFPTCINCLPTTLMSFAETRENDVNQWILWKQLLS